MSILSITNFGGELPRVSPRALPAGAAQVNSNLLATSVEFHPLLGDSTVATAVASAKTLHRLSRDASGVVRTDDTSGWISETADKNYVKGQINDDATDRTYVSFNDGSAAPRAVDASGADRILGVPFPSSLAAVLNQGEYFTRETAATYQSATLAPALLSAVIASLWETEPGARMYDDAVTPVAGPYTLHGLYWVDVGDTDYHNLRYVTPLTAALAVGLGDPRITPETDGSNLVIRISCMPFWGTIRDATALKATIGAIPNPTATAEALFSTELANNLADSLVENFNPLGPTLTGQRKILDDTLVAFISALEFVLSTVPAQPTAPTKPTVSEYTTTDGVTTRATEWVTYDGLLATYNTNLAAYNSGASASTEQKAARISEIVALQAQALRITQELEASYRDRRAGLSTLIDSFLSGRNGDFNQVANDGTNNLRIDPDRVIDPRFYFSTYTTTWGEESQPSPLTDMLDVDQYSTVSLTRSAAPPGRNIDKWNIYRSNAGASNMSSFQFVTTLPAATLTYTDEMASAELGEVCPTITWSEPPFRIDSATSTAYSLVAKGPNPYLRGLVGMPNGVMAGFIDNFVAFCDPYHPYAWPVEYQIPLDFLIVGLGSFGQSLFVGTYANPYVISGSDSASMSAQRLDDAQACLSARSIVSAGGGVLYASPDGICFVNETSVQVITTGLFSREGWQALNPESIIAAMNEGVYYFWYTGNGGGCYGLDMVAKKLVRVDISATAIFADSLTDALFYTTGTSVKRAFVTGRRTGVWKSGKVELEAHAPFAWGKVMGDQSVGSPVTLEWTGDGTLRYTKMVTDTKPWRLPPGRYLEHEVQISSAARVTKVFMAGSTDELKGVS